MISKGCSPRLLVTATTDSAARATDSPLMADAGAVRISSMPTAAHRTRAAATSSRQTSTTAPAVQTPSQAAAQLRLSSKQQPRLGTAAGRSLFSSAVSGSSRVSSQVVRPVQACTAISLGGPAPRYTATKSNPRVVSSSPDLKSCCLMVCPNFFPRPAATHWTLRLSHRLQTLSF